MDTSETKTYDSHKESGNPGSVRDYRASGGMGSPRADLDRFDTGYTSHDELPEWALSDPSMTFGAGELVGGDKAGSIKKFKNIDEDLIEAGAKAAAKPTEESELNEGYKNVADVAEATAGWLTTAGTNMEAMTMWQKHVNSLAVSADGAKSVNETLDTAIGGTVNTSPTFDGVAAANFLQETGVSMGFEDDADGLMTYTSFQNAFQYHEIDGTSLFDEIVSAPQDGCIELFDTEKQRNVKVNIDETYVSGGRSGISEDEKVSLRDYAKSRYLKDAGENLDADDIANLRNSFNEDAQRDFFGGLTIKELIYDNPDKPTYKKEVYHGARISAKIENPRTLKKNRRDNKKVTVKINGREKEIVVDSDNVLKRYMTRDPVAQRSRGEMKVVTLTAEARNYSMMGKNRLDAIRRSIKSEGELYSQYLTQALGVNRADRIVKQLNSGKYMSESAIRSHLRRSGIKPDDLNKKETQQIIKAMSEATRVSQATKNAERSSKRTTGVYKRAGQALVQDSELVQGARRVSETYRIASKITSAGASAAWNGVMYSLEGTNAIAGGVVRMTKNPKMADLVEQSRKNIEKIEKIRNAPRNYKENLEKERLRRKTRVREKVHNAVHNKLSKFDQQRRALMRRTRLGRAQLAVEDLFKNKIKSLKEVFEKLLGVTSRLTARIKFAVFVALACFAGLILVNTTLISVLTALSTPASYLSEASMREGDADYFAAAATQNAQALYDYAKEQVHNDIFGTNGVINGVLTRVQSEYDEWWHRLEEEYPGVDHEVYDNGYLDSDNKTKWSVLNYAAGNTDIFHYVNVMGDDLSTIYSADVNPSGINEYQNEAGENVYAEGLQFSNPYTATDGKIHYAMQFTSPSFRYSRNGVANNAFTTLETQGVPTQYLNAKQIMCAADFVLSQDLSNMYTPDQCLQFCKYIYSKTHLTSYQCNTTWVLTFWFEGERVKPNGEVYTITYSRSVNVPRESGDTLFEVDASLIDVALNVDFIVAPSLCSEYEEGKDHVETIYGPILVAQQSTTNQNMEKPVDFTERDVLERYEFTLLNEWQTSFDVEGYDVYGFPRDEDGYLLSGTVMYIEDRLSHDISSFGDYGFDPSSGDSSYVVGGEAGDGLTDHGFSVTSPHARLSESTQTDIYKAIIRGYSGTITTDVKRVIKRCLEEVGDEYSQPARMSEHVYDCSSLAGRMYAEQGYDYFYDAPGHIMAAAYEYAALANRGQAFYSASELKPGDLVFYSTDFNGRPLNITHVAIYIGEVDGVPKTVEALGVKWGVVYGNLRVKNIVAYGRVDTGM